MKILPLPTLLTFLLLTSVELSACPGCAENIEGVASGRAAGFGWSILLLLLLPIVIGGTITYLLRTPPKRVALFLLLPVAVVQMGGCGGEESAERVDLVDVDMSNAGSVVGVVEFPGEVPEPESIEVAGDPYCGEGDLVTTIETQNVLVEGGRLANVFVYVSSGLEGLRFPEAGDSALLDQKGCTYYPRVQGVRTGQPIIIRNSDPTIHNVHARPEENDQFNIGQRDLGETVRSFDRPEVLIPITCDVHGWMKSYIAVLDHPAFATTGSDGAFRFDLPPGAYTITAWHERYGERETSVTVEPGKNVVVNFTYLVSSTSKNEGE